MSGSGSITIVPAYGRDYKSKRALMEDWYKGLDFLINDVSSAYNGRLINIEDAVRTDIVEIRARYGDLRRVTIFPTQLKQK